MHVTGGARDDDIRLTVEAAFDLANAMLDGADPETVRRILVEHDFSGAEVADNVEVVETHRSLAWLAALLDDLPGADVRDAVAVVNRALAGRAVTPMLASHDHYPLHIHWTTDTVPLSGRVVVDILMALGEVLCDHGTERFGRCDAAGCDALFYDATKNRSRRFCNDPRCASRTHTANHRARKDAAE